MSKFRLSKISFLKAISRSSHKGSLFSIIYAISIQLISPKIKSQVLAVSENPNPNELNSGDSFEMSNKVSSKCYKGIFYLHLTQLPIHQKYSILKWTDLKTIKIKTESALLTDCIQYDKYESWYNKVYKHLMEMPEQKIA